MEGRIEKEDLLLKFWLLVYVGKAVNVPVPPSHTPKKEENLELLSPKIRCLGVKSN